MLRVCLAWVIAVLPALAQELPADLKLVPTNAAGFAHIKLADAWKSDAVKDFRDILAFAGPKAFEQLDKEFHPAPGTIERVTSILLEVDGEHRGPVLLTALAFSKPFDREKIVREYFADAKPKKAGAKEYWNDEPKNIAVHFADDQTLLVANGATMLRYLTRAPKADGPLVPLLAAAAKHPMAVGVLPQSIVLPKFVLEDMPEQVLFLLKAKSLLVIADNHKTVRLAGTLAFEDEDRAEKGLEGIRSLGKLVRDHPEWKFARQEAEAMVFDPKKTRKLKAGEHRSLEQFGMAVMGLFGLAGLNWADKQLSEPPVKRVGDTIAMEIVLPSYTAPFFDLGIAASSILQFSAQVELIEAPAKVAQNNLKQIALAVHNYYAANDHTPPAAICDKNGKPLLSWRVAILPYLEQENAYYAFKLDEPWDSAHNMKVGRSIRIKVYDDPRLPIDYAKPQKTYYKAFVGKDAGFERTNSRKFTEFPDGLSNTVMVAAAGEPVFWWKPEDFEFDAAKKAPDVTKPFDEVLVAMFDGSVRTLQPKKYKDFDAFLKLLIQRNDGESLPDPER